MSVADRFRTLLDRVQPSATSKDTFDTHRASVSSCLRSAFNTAKIELIGSNARNTAIGGFSDVDLLLVLRKTEVTWGPSIESSDTVLKNVRKQLESRFKNTDIGRDGQAVVVSFRDGDHPVDVVPAFFDGPGRDNYPVFKIPDGAGSWMKTSPGLHNKYIAEADILSGHKLRSTARLLKFWRTTRTTPLNSFHIELLLAKEAICTVAKGLSECLADALQELTRRECRALQDPMGVSGWIPAANTDAMRGRALASVRDAADHARRAVEATSWGTFPDAYRQWDIVFNGEFPKS